MIAEHDVREMAERYLEGHEFSLRRSSGGFLTMCGWQISILDDIPGTEHTVFIHENNDRSALQSKMIRFSEAALTT